jgi:hypothetical protein
MRFRYLRITWSLLCGILCSLLIVFCIRSFTWADQSAVRVSATHHLMVCSQLGGISFLLDGSPRVIRTSTSVDVLYPEGPKPQFSGHFSVYQGQLGVSVPHWFLALTCAIMATIPWEPWKWKFSLRTLLIATTLVAVVLGLIVARSR